MVYERQAMIHSNNAQKTKSSNSAQKINVKNKQWGTKEKESQQNKYQTPKTRKKNETPKNICEFVTSWLVMEFICLNQFLSIWNFKNHGFLPHKSHVGQLQITLDKMDYPSDSFFSMLHRILNPYCISQKMTYLCEANT